MSMTVAEALALDAVGDWERRTEIETTLLAAATAHLDDYGLVIRTFNYLCFSGTPAQHHQELLAAVIADQPMNLRLVRRIILPIIGMLIERGDYTAAYQLLQRVPSGIEAQMVRELDRELTRWFRTSNDEVVVGWERLADDWWKKLPTQLPAQHDGQPLTQWLAANVSYFEDNAVHLHCGWAEKGQDEPSFGFLTQPYSDWLAAGGPELQPGEQTHDAFWEIGVYGYEPDFHHYQLPVPDQDFWRTLAPAQPDRSRYSRSSPNFSQLHTQTTPNSTTP